MIHWIINRICYDWNKLLMSENSNLGFQLKIYINNFLLVCILTRNTVHKLSYKWFFNSCSFWSQPKNLSFCKKFSLFPLLLLGFSLANWLASCPYTQGILDLNPSGSLWFWTISPFLKHSVTILDKSSPITNSTCIFRKKLMYYFNIF